MTSQNTQSLDSTAAQGEPVATKWAMYFSGEPENPQLKPGFMANWCLYSDVLSVQSECDKANESYAERDSATAGHKPYVARQVFIFANPPEPAGVVEAGTVGVSLYKPDGWTEAEEMQAGFALAALAHTPELAGFTFADNQWRHMCRVFSRADEMLDAQVEALAATSAKPADEVKPLTTKEIADLTAMVWGAPCADDELKKAELIIRAYEALKPGERPKDPVDGGRFLDVPGAFGEGS